MQLLKTTIKPNPNFASAIRGDTLFGQLCWMIHFRYGEKRLEELLANYDKKPFMVVSDAFASGYLPKPKLPISKLLFASENKKDERKKQWIKYDDLQTLSDACKLKDKQDKTVNIMHNSINYQTFTTDDKNFAPYATQEVIMGSNKDIYCLIDKEQFSKDELNETFKMLRDYGYGKDTSIGKGRFTFSDFEDTTYMMEKSSVTVMTLSPFSPQGLLCEKIYYEPFTRFGKKGALRSHENPFKRPLLLADTASVIVFKEPYKEPYVGKAIRGHTTHEDIVHQGYAIVVAIKEIS
jgi:CRISPR-associated protein Csm4